VPLRPRGGRLRFTPPDKGLWKLAAFAMQVEAFKGSGCYSVNSLAPEPTRQFIRLTHQAYARRYRRHFGNTVEGFFLDEPRFNNAMPWDERLHGWFKQRKGYDPRPHLPLLTQDALHGAHETFRRDYRAVLADLYCRNFFKPVGDWCAAQGLKLTGHLMAEETLAGHHRFSADGLRPYRHFSLPGVDHLGPGLGGLAARPAAAEVWKRGGGELSCETFAGCGWNFTPDEMKTITHWLFCQGVTLIIPHAFFYAGRNARQRNVWPPSMFFQWKHWSHYPAYVSRVSRLSALMQGRAMHEVGMAYPLEIFQKSAVNQQAFRTGYFKKGPRHGKAAQQVEEAWQVMGQGMLNRQVDWRLVDPEQPDFKGLKVLVLPVSSGWPAAFSRKVKAFAAQGGKVYVPDMAKGEAKALAGLQRMLRKPDFSLSGPAWIRGKVMEVDSRLHDPYVHRNLRTLLKKGGGGLGLRRLWIKRGGLERVLLANYEKRAMGLRVDWKTRGCIWRIDAAGGQAVELKARRRAGRLSFGLRLEPLEALVLECRP
jgi:hypothetical protein